MAKMKKKSLSGSTFIDSIPKRHVKDQDSILSMLLPVETTQRNAIAVKVDKYAGTPPALNGIKERKRNFF